MNKIYSIIAAFAVLSGVSVASDHNQKPEQTPDQKTEVFEHLDEVVASRGGHERRSVSSEMEEEVQGNVEVVEELERAKTFDSDDAESMNLNEGYLAERIEQRSGLRYYIGNVRKAWPLIGLTTGMGVLTVNEVINGGNTGPSFIVMSGLAFLSGFNAWDVIRSGQRTLHNLIPGTVQEMGTTAASLIPGLMYSGYNYMRTTEVSEEIKVCVTHCAKRCLGLNK